MPSYSSNCLKPPQEQYTSEITLDFMVYLMLDMAFGIEPSAGTALKVDTCALPQMYFMVDDIVGGGADTKAALPVALCSLLHNATGILYHIQPQVPDLLLRKT